MLVHEVIDQIVAGTSVEEAVSALLGEWGGLMTKDAQGNLQPGGGSQRRANRGSVPIPPSTGQNVARKPSPVPAGAGRQPFAVKAGMQAIKGVQKAGGYGGPQPTLPSISGLGRRLVDKAVGGGR